MAQISANGSRGHHKITLNVNETYVSGSSENYSNVGWSLVLSPIQTGWDWYYSGTAPVGYKVNINGSEVANGNIMSYDGSSTVTVASGTTKVFHNDNGTKSIDFSFEVWDKVSANYLTGSASANGSLKLTDIPRYANVTNTISSKTETSARITWTSDQTIDHLSYSINDGTTWNDLDTQAVKSGMYEITGLKANTTYNVKTKVRRKDNQLVSQSSRVQLTTYDYPYSKKLPDFVIGEEVQIELYNPLNREVTLHFIGANGEELSSDITAMETVVGYNTESFKTKLYNSIPNSNKGGYKLQVVYGESTKTTDGGTYFINEAECTPIFTDFEYKDINTKIVEITGNDKLLIKDFSQLQVIVDSGNKMIPQKGASPLKYNTVIEGINQTASHGDDDIVLDLGSINASGIKRLTVTAYDSRNVQKSTYKDLSILDYTKPVVTLEASRINNFEAETILKVNGTYDKLIVDDSEKNSIQSVEYRYREIGDTVGEWSEWTTINTTLSNGKFTCNDVVVNLDNTKPFEIEVRASDKLDSSSTTDTIESGKSIFFISTNKKKCYINDKQVMAGVGEDINRTDLNDYTKDFVAGYGHNLTNSPIDTLNQGHLLSIPRHDAEGFVTQYFSPYPTNDIYVRKCDEGVWGKWYLITNNYSNKEERIGTYSNKPLYRKVINTGVLPNAKGKQIDHGISDIDQIVSIKGHAYRSSDDTTLPLPHTANNETAISCYSNKRYITIVTYTDRSNFATSYITLEYTKTTD